MAMAHILLIDDDPVFREIVHDILNHLGHDCHAFATLAEGKNALSAKPCDIVLLDIFLPDGNGLDEINHFKNRCTQPQVIMITAHGNPDEAAQAIEQGAWDYLEKPVNIETIKLLIKRSLEYRKYQAENNAGRLRQPDPIIGRSSGLTKCLQQVENVAKSNTSVLISGETGTGKELFARTLHCNSLRAHQKFVVVDCASLQESLAESALLGHRKGAFTDARQERTGLIKLADQGTLFLDEIGELPFSLQKILLRVLQEKTFLPLGSEQEQHSDFRLIAASNKNLKQMVNRREFRDDLYYRIFTYPIHLPPLRERENDIELLSEFFIEQKCKELGLARKRLSAEFLSVLTEYSWPGNVRELINTLDVVIKNGYFDPVLLPQHLPTGIRSEVIRSHLQKGNPAQSNTRLSSIACLSCPSWFNRQGDDLPTLKSLREKTIAGMERAYLELLLQRSENKPKLACHLSGLSKARLYELLKKHHLGFNESES